MENNQNTPPHAELQVTITRHQGAVLQDAKVYISGCRGCLTEAIASHLLASPPFKELINNAIRLANERRAQKEN